MKDREIIDISEVLDVFLVSSKKIFVSSLTFSLLMFLFTFLLTDIYRAQSILSVETSTESNYSNLSNQYGSIAALAGVNMPSSSKEEKALLAIQTIQSRDFLKTLSRINNLILPNLLAANHYDKDTGLISYNETLFDIENSSWKENTEFSSGLEPSILEAHEVYIDILSISFNSENGFIYISIDHLSPKFAKEFIEIIVSELNDSIRSKDLLKSSESLTFLYSELAKSQISDIKNSINQLIKNQLETQMLANVNKDYVISYLDRPYEAIERLEPNRMLIGLVTFILIFSFGTFGVLFKHYVLNKN